MPIDAKRFVYMGNGNKALVEVIGLFRLHLESGCYLDLDETFYVSSFRRNLVYVSCWTNLVILIHLEIEKLVFFNIQI